MGGVAVTEMGQREISSVVIVRVHKVATVVFVTQEHFYFSKHFNITHTKHI